MKRLVLITLALSALSCASATNLDAGRIPLSVSKVTTFRVGDNLVRVIQHNMEMKPQLELELIAVPEPRLLDTTLITSIKVGNQILDFTNSSGAFVESVEEDNGQLKVDFDYFYLEGGSDLIECKMAVMNAKLGEFRCSR